MNIQMQVNESLCTVQFTRTTNSTRSWGIFRQYIVSSMNELTSFFLCFLECLLGKGFLPVTWDSHFINHSLRANLHRVPAKSPPFLFYILLLTAQLLTHWMLSDFRFISEVWVDQIEKWKLLRMNHSVFEKWSDKIKRNTITIVWKYFIFFTYYLRLH